MEDIRSKFAVTIFLCVIIIFVVGGYFGMNYMVNRPKDNKDDITEISAPTDMRIDETKDHIYVSENNYVIEEYAIGHPDIVINYTKGSELAEQLNSEVNSYTTSTVMLTEENKPAEELAFANEEGILSTKYRGYEIIEYDKYVTLISEDYDYSAINYTTATNVKSYTLNKETGNIITEEELLKIYNLNIIDIKELVKKKLEILNLDTNINKVDETMNDFNYAVYLNNLGKMEIKYLVKSTKQNYYDKLVIN